MSHDALEIDERPVSVTSETAAKGSALLFFTLVLAVLIIWTQAQPFPDFRAYAWYSPIDSSSVRVLATLAISAFFVLVFAAEGRLASIRALATADVILILGFFVATSLLSQFPGLALNRLGLAALILFIGFSCVAVLPGPGALLTLLAAAATAAVAVSFLGVAIIPELSIHTLADTTEPNLAGDWRGVFAHKNDLAAMCAYFVFFAVYLLRTGQRGWGFLLLIGTLALLFMSGGKTAELLLVPTLIVAALVVRARSTFGTLAIALGALLGMVAVTIGTLFLPWLADLMQTLLPDATYTGRTDIWALAVRAIARSPWLGYGYNVFWDTRQTIVVGGWDSTAALVAHAHNGYLETMISAGVPGLALTLLFALVVPLRHILRIKAQPLIRRGDPALECLVEMWLFTLLLSGFEAVLFNRGNAMWFCGVLAIFSLRFWPGGNLPERADG